MSFLSCPSLFKSVLKNAQVYNHAYTCTYVCTKEYTCLWLYAYRDRYTQLQMAEVLPSAAHRHTGVILSVLRRKYHIKSLGFGENLEKNAMIPK